MAGAPAILAVAGLGDSVPAGSACGCTSYISLVGQQLAQREGRQVTVSNLASNGLDTSQLLAQLQAASVRAVLAHADLVIVTIGANDFDQDTLTSADCAPATELSCYADPLAALRDRLTAVLAGVRALQPATGQLVVTGYWNVFLDGEVGLQQGSSYVAASDALTLATNDVISSVSATQSARYVDLYAAFKGADGRRDDTALLAPDGDHPDGAGHRLIAATILAALDR